MIDGFFGEYRFLSNFWNAPVSYEGITYQNNECAFQAMKTLDKEERMAFADLAPNEGKRKGRRVTLRKDWEEVKTDIMLDICRAKFSQNEDLKAKLLATGDEYLQETNTWNDTCWGVCRGKGENRLGKILMQVREELRGK